MTPIRLDALFFAIWGLLIAPSFCEAGLLAHVCLEHAGVDCGHEEDCPDDPCSSAALRPAASKDDSSAPSTVCAFPLVLHSWSTILDLRMVAQSPCASPPCTRTAAESFAPLRL
jgi:hypothetical protein